jgi:hypothetical protein
MQPARLEWRGTRSLGPRSDWGTRPTGRRVKETTAWVISPMAGAPPLLAVEVHPESARPGDATTLSSASCRARSWTRRTHVVVSRLNAGLSLNWEAPGCHGGPVLREGRPAELRLECCCRGSLAVA